MHLDDDGKYDGQVIDNAVHPPELIFEEDLDGFDLHEVLKLLEDTSANHSYEGNPGRVESIEVVLGTPVWVFSEHLQYEAQKDEKEGGEMWDAAMDWWVKGVEEVAGIEEVQDPVSRPVLHSTEEAWENLAKEMPTGKKWSECKLEEEMKKLGDAVLMRPAAPAYPLLGQHLNTDVSWA